MNAFAAQADTRGQALFTIAARALRVTALAAVLGITLSAGTAQAADSNDRIVPPSPAEVAMLRQLLALQHPTLRGATTPGAATVPPTVTTQPSPQLGHAASAIEGGACVGSSCDVGPQASASSSKLNIAFRQSLERSMAAAGYAGGNF